MATKINKKYIQFGSGTNDVNAGVVPTNTASFNNNLSGTDTDIQTALQTLNNLQLPRKSAGDINETSFSASNNISSAANVTGLAFANATVRSFEALVSIYINATGSLYEQVRLIGIQRGSDWQMTDVRVGDDSGLVFSITTAGQIQYTSTNISGFTSNTIKFRAITTSV